MTAAQHIHDDARPVLTIGAFPLADGGTRFRVWAPCAAHMDVVLGSPPSHSFPMARTGGGLFEATILEAQPGADYFYLIDGAKQRPDPASRHQPLGVHGPSRIVNAQAFAWSDADWQGLPLEQYVLYELHIGTFTPAGTFDAAIARLPALRELGVTAIELMPVAAFPGERNWGYDGVALFAVQESYGGPEGLKRFVDACHQHGLACVLDVVYNHLGPDGNYLADFAPYFCQRYKTPWGEALNFDGAQSDEVRRFFVENALHWLRDYHVDALRLDAIHSIFDFSARHILSEIQDAFSAEAARLGRRAYLIAESDLNDVRVLQAREQGGLGLSAQWSDDFHHAVHAVALADRHGYFADFGELDDIATALTQGFVYHGQYSACRQRRHGSSSAGLPGSQFVICTQNHDQIANGSQGRRLGVQVPFEQQKLLACLLVLAPQLPLLFMGQEFGSLSPFHYFVSHSDPQLIEAVRSGRRAEFAAFAAAGEFADPQAEATFEACKLDWWRRCLSPHAEILALHHDLLKLRRQYVCLHNCRPDLTRVQVDPDQRYLVVERADPSGEYAVALLNFSRLTVSIPLPISTLDLRLALTSSDPRYGGEEDSVLPPAVLTAQPTEQHAVSCLPFAAQLYVKSGDT